MRYIAARPEGKICLFGAPFDSTTSFRPGSRFGPPALREASYSLETYSPIQDADLTDVSFMDMGDIELPFGDPVPGLALIRSQAQAILDSGRIPFLLGGEHLVTLGVIQALAHAYSDLKVIHLDAHADLRHDYLGQTLSHATVMRRIADVIGLENIRQIGIRSLDKPERELVNQLKSTIYDAITWAGSSPCYVTCDLDILDPSIFPGTGTPEPGGMSFMDLVQTLIALLGQVRCVGLDMVELAPNQDISGVSSVVAAKVVRECLIVLGQRNLS
jgi:agmatinase